MSNPPPSQPALSVVMACYNEERYVSRAIRSILQQDFTDFEFIIVDDGSSDQSWKIIKTFSDLDDRIIPVQNKKNLGLAESLNRGIRLASTNYIARMDADDIALPSRFRVQYHFLENHPQVDILGSGAFLINKESGHSAGTVRLPERHEEIVSRAFKKTLVIHPSIMLRKQVFTEFGFYDPRLKWAEDADLWYRIYDQVHFYNLPQTLLFYSQKSSVNFRMIRINLYVKIKNLRRRNLLLKHLHILLKDAFVLSLRYIRNF
jgi:glycosyltransferase involved in cell wall biosynthesis